MRISGLVILLSLIGTSSVVSLAQSEHGALLKRADSLYSVQQFNEAGKLYQELIDAGYASPAALLRNARLNEGRGETEKALASLYRYHRLTRDPAAYQKMLELAESKDLAGYEISEGGFILQWLESTANIALPLLAATALLLVSLQYRLKRKNPEIGRAHV